MAFESFQDFIAMGGHGLYVWLAYGMFSALVVGMLVSSVQQATAMRRRILRLMEREQFEASQALADAEKELP